MQIINHAQFYNGIVQHYIGTTQHSIDREQKKSDTTGDTIDIT
ncbi:hypothetical protein [Sphingobacterium phlebotomi]|nr:hypothetical protein [Sphingobacterium phlebotomi]